MPFYPLGRDPFHCSLGGGEGRIEVHLTGYALGSKINGWELRSRHILYMVKTKEDLLSYRRVYTPSVILSVNSEVPAFLCMP